MPASPAELLAELTLREKAALCRGATVVGNFSLSSLATFPGTGLDHTTVSALVRRFAVDPEEKGRHQ